MLHENDPKRVPYSFLLVIVATLFICVGCGPSLPDAVEEAYAELPEKIDYNFHVKPILADRCMLAMARMLDPEKRTFA